MAHTLENQTNAEDAQRDTKDDSSSASGPAASAIPQQPPTYPKDDNAETKRRWINDPPMFWVTLAGVVAVVAYTSVAAWQACLTGRQLDVMQGQLDEMKLPSAERPFLFVIHDDSQPAAPQGEPLFPGKVFNAVFKNYGKTPAIYRGFQPRCGYFATNPPDFQFTNDKWAASVLIGVARR